MQAELHLCGIEELEASKAQQVQQKMGEKANQEGKGHGCKDQGEGKRKTEPSCQGVHEGTVTGGDPVGTTEDKEKNACKTSRVEALLKASTDAPVQTEVQEEKGIEEGQDEKRS